MEWPRSQRRGREPDALHRSAVKLQSAMLITVTRLLPRRLSSRQGEQSPVLRLISVFSEWTETLLPKGISCNSTSSRCLSETQPGPKSIHKPAGHFAETPSNTASDNRVPKPLRSPGGCTSTCQVTSLTLKSLKTSPYLENLGISRVDARWQALIRPEGSPFLGHLLLAADADFCGSLNTSRSSNFLLIFFYHPPPTSGAMWEVRLCQEIFSKEHQGETGPPSGEHGTCLSHGDRQMLWKSLAVALCTSIHGQPWSGVFVANCQLKV